MAFRKTAALEREGRRTSTMSDTMESPREWITQETTSESWVLRRSQAILRPSPEVQSGFSIFVDTLRDGTVPAERDGHGHPIVYATEIDAQRPGPPVQSLPHHGFSSAQ